MNTLNNQTNIPTSIANNENMNSQAVSLITDLYKLHPEIAQKVLEHGAPELGKTARETITSAKDVSIRGFQSVDQSANRMYNLYDKNSEALIKCLNDENTSDEVKIKVIDAINETNKTVAEGHVKIMQHAAEESSKQWAGGLIATSIIATFLGASLSALTGLPFKFK